MADTLKVLGQADLAATTLTDVYTVPAATSTTVSSIVICNRAGTSTTFRVSVSVAGAADDVKQYIYYGLTIPANETFIATVGLTLAATDVLRFYAAASSVTASAYGVEVT